MNSMEIRWFCDVDGKIFAIAEENEEMLYAEGDLEKTMFNEYIPYRRRSYT